MPNLGENGPLVFAIGGDFSSTSMEVFNGTNWTPSVNPPYGSQYSESIAYNNSILMIGGQNAGEKLISKFDLETNSWSQFLELKNAMYEHVAFLVPRAFCKN